MRQEIILIKEKGNLVDLGVIVCKAEKNQPDQGGLGDRTSVNICIPIGQLNRTRGGAEQCRDICRCCYTRLNRLKNRGVEGVIFLIGAKYKTTRTKKQEG